MEFFSLESILHKKSVFPELVYDADFAMFKAFVHVFLCIDFLN